VVIVSDHDEEQKLHNETSSVVTERLRAYGVVEDSAIITGWVISYETVDAVGDKTAGYIYGPQDMSSWRVIGLIEWIKSHLLAIDND
jgi:3-hydroxyacyl-CoA dehydrogenase